MKVINIIKSTYQPYIKPRVFHCMKKVSFFFNRYIFLSTRFFSSSFYPYSIYETHYTHLTRWYSSKTTTRLPLIFKGRCARARANYVNDIWVSKSKQHEKTQTIVSCHVSLRNYYILIQVAFSILTKLQSRNWMPILLTL